jgi:hypothetical protein
MPSNPYGPAGEAGCSYGVDGSVETWVAPASSWAWLWTGGSLECEGSVAGISQTLGINLGPLHGPGTYTTTGGSSYQRAWCASGETDCTYDTFKSDAAQGCVAALTVAPDDASEVGAKVAGTFRCSQLTDPADPSRQVAVYAGSFWATIEPPPE